MSFRPELSVLAAAAVFSAPMGAPEVVDALAIDTTTTRVGDVGNSNGEHGTFQDCAQASYGSVIRAYIDGGIEGEKVGRYDWKFGAEPVEVIDPVDESKEPLYCAGTRKVTTKISIGKKAIRNIVTIGNASVSTDDSDTFPLKYINGRVKVKAETVASYTDDGVTTKRKLPTECVLFYKKKDDIYGIAPTCSNKPPRAEDGPITTDG